MSVGSSAALKKPAYPKRTSSLVKKYRSLALYVAVPLVGVLGVAFWPQIAGFTGLETKGFAKKQRDLERQQKKIAALEKKAEELKAKKEKLMSGMWDQVYGTFWSANETELVEYKKKQVADGVAQTVDNSVLLFVYAGYCVYCKNFAMQLMNHFELSRPIDLDALNATDMAEVAALPDAKLKSLQHAQSFNLTDAQKFEQTLFANVKVAALDADKLSEEFRKEHKIERFPTLLLMKDEKTFVPHEDIPIVNDG